MIIVAIGRELRVILRRESLDKQTSRGTIVLGSMTRPHLSIEVMRDKYCVTTADIAIALCFNNI